MAKDPGPLPLLDAVESALMAAGERMRWADDLAERLIDTPTMVRVEIETALRQRLIGRPNVIAANVSEWEAGALAMRDSAAAHLTRTALMLVRAASDLSDVGGAALVAEGERMIRALNQRAAEIKALPLPPPPSKEAAGA